MEKYLALYIRLSIEDEDMTDKSESDSVSNQRNLLRSYVKNSELSGYNIVEYCDDGFTGTKFGRPQYTQMLEDVRAGKISCIVVKDLSRLGRDYLEVGSLLEQILPLYSVRVIAINDHFDSANYNGMTGGMNVAFKNLIYMLYSRDLSKKVSSAMHTRVMNGENIAGQLRYGYKKDPNDKHKIIIDEEAAEVVRLIFELTVQGKRRTDVANYLNELGIDTPSVHKKKRGCKNKYHSIAVRSLWATASVSDILNDEVYLGKLIWNKTKKRVGNNNTSTYIPKEEWIVIENAHEPIISQELFDKAHEAVPAMVRPKRGKRNYSPFYYCGICGRAMSQSKRVKGDILLCSSSRVEADSPCKCNRVELATVDNAVLSVVKAYASAYMEEKGVKKVCVSKTVSPEKQIESLENSIKSLSGRKLKLYADYKDEKLSREEFKTASEKIAEQIESMKQEIEDWKSQIIKDDDKLDSFSQDLKQNSELDDFDKELARKVIKKVVINGSESIEVVWNTDDPFFQ